MSIVLFPLESLSLVPFGGICRSFFLVGKLALPHTGSSFCALPCGSKCYDLAVVLGGAGGIV